MHVNDANKNCDVKERITEKRMMIIQNEESKLSSTDSNYQDLKQQLLEALGAKGLFEFALFGGGCNSRCRQPVSEAIAVINVSQSI